MCFCPAARTFTSEEAKCQDGILEMSNLAKTADVLTQKHQFACAKDNRFFARRSRDGYRCSRHTAGRALPCTGVFFLFFIFSSKVTLTLKISGVLRQSCKTGYVFTLPGVTQCIYYLYCASFLVMKKLFYHRSFFLALLKHGGNN